MFQDCGQEAISVCWKKLSCTFPSNCSTSRVGRWHKNLPAYWGSRKGGKRHKHISCLVLHTRVVRTVIWAESRCGQLWCDQSLPGCRPIVDLGLYEVIHWERDEHCVSKQNGTQESHIGAILLCGVISCYFHLSLSLTLCQWQFVFCWSISPKLFCMNGEGQTDPHLSFPSFLLWLHQRIWGTGWGRGWQHDTYFFSFSCFILLREAELVIVRIKTFV